MAKIAVIICLATASLAIIAIVGLMVVDIPPPSQSERTEISVPTPKAVQ